MANFIGFFAAGSNRSKGSRGSEVQRFRVQRFKVQRFKVQRFKVQRFKRLVHDSMDPTCA
jgi:hypothetical protein